MTEPAMCPEGVHCLDYDCRLLHVGERRTQEALPKVTTLECDHCGDVAFESKSGWFADGDGGRCLSCGYPGHVVCDSETPAEWSTGQEETDFCAVHNCDECNERRALQRSDKAMTEPNPEPTPPFCGAETTIRDDEHRVMVCDRPWGHEGEHWARRVECEWTDAATRYPELKDLTKVEKLMINIAHYVAEWRFGDQAGHVFSYICGEIDKVYPDPDLDYPIPEDGYKAALEEICKKTSCQETKRCARRALYGSPPGPPPVPWVPSVTGKPAQPPGTSQRDEVAWLLNSALNTVAMNAHPNWRSRAHAVLAELCSDGATGRDPRSDSVTTPTTKGGTP